MKKNKILATTEKVVNQTNQFHNMNQVASETETVAIGITNNLKIQREMLLKADTAVNNLFIFFFPFIFMLINY